MSSRISAKAKWNVNEASIKRLTNRYVNKNLANVERIVDWYAHNAAYYIEEYKVLSGSPTGTAWHRNKNAERGFKGGARVDTGYMARSIGYDSYSFNSDNEIGAEFGLRMPSAGGENYFIQQERGFTLETKNGARKVPGMHSAEAAHKWMRPRFRKQMLAAGFLYGKDVRGQTVLALMGGAAGKPMSFDAAYAATGKTASAAQRAAYDSLQKKINDRELNRFIREKAAEENRRVVEASRGSSQAGYNAYIGFKAASKRKAGF